jgi:NADH:ubiquinone oxidoreductase subunit F (NADH-binding)
MSGTNALAEPRLLAGLPEHGAMTLEQHAAVHGELPPPASVLADVEAAGLRGRGGAAFPTAVKLAAAAAGRRPIVVVNGAEGEPMSRKDGVLLTRLPHLVLDGAALAAQAIGAREIVVAAPASVLDPVAAAVGERRDPGRIRWRLERSAPGYVAGEETALLAGLEGRPALPRTKPPLPPQRGLRGRPTLIQNAETLAQVALIVRYGPDWFRSAGTLEHPGTMLVTLSGAVAAPGVYEVVLGTPLAELQAIAGGAVEPVRAVLVGGYFGAWVHGDGEGLALDDASLAAVGAGVGAGVVVALGVSACPVAEVAGLAAWLSEASTGQCGPCVHGLGALAQLLERVAAGRILQGDGARLARWTGMVQGRGACRHPDGAARMIESATRVFGDELNDHARRGHGRACAVPRTLQLPPQERVAA